jgi:hypothetical protein
MTQVWDASAGVGATAFAEKDVPLSTTGEGIKYYRGKEDLPARPETNKWFANLMIE